MQAVLERSSTKETELFTPQQYEATFERRLFSNALGLDIRLTQGWLLFMYHTRLM